MKPLRVIVADDSELAREATRNLLERDSGFRVVAEAVDGHDAINKVARHEPELVLMDLNMPRCDGIVATRVIRRQHPHVIVVMLTVSNEATDLFAAIQSGAQGYLLKNLNPTDWLAYLRMLVADMPTVPPAMAHRLFAQFRAPDPTLSGVETPSEPILTERETEVLRLVAQAYTDRQIAERLYISMFTVKNHVRNIRAKIGAANRVELALYAGRNMTTQAGS